MSPNDPLFWWLMGLSWGALFLLFFAAFVHLYAFPRFVRLSKKIQRAFIRPGALNPRKLASQSSRRRSLVELPAAPRSTPADTFSNRCYFAFISYAHADKKYASWVRRRLETFKVHYPIRSDGVVIAEGKLGLIFQDDADLGAATDLGRELRSALDASENLVVICSPHSAKSRWVNEEIRHFRKTWIERKQSAESPTGQTEIEPGRIIAIIKNDIPKARAASARPPGDSLPPALLEQEMPTGSSLTIQGPETIVIERDRKSGRNVIAQLVAGGFGAPVHAVLRDGHTRAREVVKILLIGLFALAALMLLTPFIGRLYLSAFAPRIE